MGISNIKEFSLPELCNNSDGKTSASGTMAALIIATGCLAFLTGVADFMWVTSKPDVMMYATGIISIGAGLLGYRKSHDGPLAKKVIEDAATKATEEKVDNPDAEPEEDKPLNS